MPVALVGTWTGTVNEPWGIVKEWTQTYVIEPCDAAGTCGSFEMHGLLVEERPNYPWAHLDDTWQCSGDLLLDGFDGDTVLVVASSQKADPPESIDTCGMGMVALTPAPDGGLTFTGYAWGKTILQRGLLLPVAESPAASTPTP